MKTLATVCALALTAVSLAGTNDLVTVAESSDFTRTSLYAEVVDFVTAAAAASEKIRVAELGTSAGGLSIPLVVVSNRGLATAREARLYGLPRVLIIANIHAGEVEGKEALLMLLRDVVEGRLDGELDNQVLLLVPIFNPDGNDALGDNRRDNGPELAGIRFNAQNLDLNRDFIKLETSEVRALVRLIQLWEPVLFVDMHTTNGSYHREPVTYTTAVHANTSERLQDYMWQQLFPAVSTTLAQEWGWDSVPYGNFEDRTEPDKGWRNHAFAARYSTNYAGLRNIFTILDENYSHADYKTRVLSSHALVRSILSYTHRHIAEMQELVNQEAIRTREGFQERGWVSEYQVAKLMDVTIKSYVFEVEAIPEDELEKYPAWLDGVLVKPTDRHQDYTVPYFSRAVATTTSELPAAYLIPAIHRAAINNLADHGIVMEELGEATAVAVERFHVDALEPADRPNQGHVTLAISGSWKAEQTTVPAGTVLVPLRQPLARLIPALLEPEAADSLATWGVFTSWIVPQWRRDLNPYPVLRLPEIPPGLERSRCCGYSR
jgi:hypothetical protein